MTANNLPEPVAYLRAKNGVPQWGEDCVCQDPVYPSDPDGSDADCVSMPLYTASDLALAVREAIEPLKHAGAMLSNCAFNLAQRDPGQFTERDIEALDSSRKAWDAAIRALAGGKRGMRE